MGCNDMEKKVYDLLIESSADVAPIMEETGNGSKQMFIEGIFAQAEVKNGNGRVYKRDVLENAMEKYRNNYVSKNKALGEINHPDYPFANQKMAAIRVVEMRMDGNNVYGKALVLNTPEGQILRGLLEGGYVTGVSTRGLGTIKEQGGVKYVQDNYMMTAVDCVDNPSAPEAIMNTVVESTKWTLNESTGVWVPVVKPEETDAVNEQLFLEKLESFLKSNRRK